MNLDMDDQPETHRLGLSPLKNLTQGVKDPLDIVRLIGWYRFDVIRVRNRLAETGHRFLS
jgi:hypothetical protein